MDKDGPARAEAERDIILATLHAAVMALEGAIPAGIEVVLHEIARLPESIVAIAGHVTGRKVGDPATDLLLEMAVRGKYETITDYEVHLPTVGLLKCTTTVIADSAGEAVAVLCVNRNIGVWQSLADAAASILAPESTRATSSQDVRLVTVPASADRTCQTEQFARSVAELADQLLVRSVERTGKQVSRMRKAEKIEVVRELQERGFFLLRDSIETAARTLDVSRFTIYNYLNQLEDQASHKGA